MNPQLGVTKEEDARIKSEKEPKAWDLYIKGYTYKQIAKMVDLSATTVARWIQEGRTILMKRNGNLPDEYSHVEMERLDLMLQLLMRDMGTIVETQWTWNKDKKTGEHVYKLIKEEFQRVDINIINTILKVQERRARYLNLDVAKHIEITHMTLEELVLSSYKKKEEAQLPAPVKVVDVVAEEVDDA